MLVLLLLLLLMTLRNVLLVGVLVAIILGEAHERRVPQAGL